MIILALSLTAWAILRKYANRPKRRETVYNSPQIVVSPAELERRARERERAAKEAERAETKRQREEERERKAEAERQQAEADKVFLVEQIDKLYTMLWDADSELKTARQTCQHDSEMNRAGAVIADKMVSKHRAERDKLERKVMQLERNIHSYETKLTKAQQIVQN